LAPGLVRFALHVRYWWATFGGAGTAGGIGNGAVVASATGVSSARCGSLPAHLALKPDGGEVFSTNFDSDTISEIDTWNNTVLGTYAIGNRPSRAITSGWSKQSVIPDNDDLWVSNFGAESTSLYAIDEGRVANALRAGSRPDALAFSADEHLLLVANYGSGDVSVFRMLSKDGPSLVTLLPAGLQPNDIAVKAFRAK